jgi:hypothetical protein
MHRNFLKLEIFLNGTAKLKNSGFREKSNSFFWLPGRRMRDHLYQITGFAFYKRLAVKALF